MNKFEVQEKVSGFIDSIALSGLRRISPNYVANQIGAEDVQAVFDSLMRLVNHKVIVKYEVKCTECGTGNKVVFDTRQIEGNLSECRFCHEEYIPNPDFIWVVFDIDNEFKDYMIEQGRRYGGGSDFFALTGGVTLKEAAASQPYQAYRELADRWNIDLGRFSGLLNEVVIAPDLRKEGQITTRQQGDTLEDLLKFIFDGAPTIFNYQGKLITHTSEIDGVAEVLSDHGFLRNWPPYLVNEAKNWSIPVGKDPVVAFISKIENANAHVGIMFSREGITGEKDHSAARSAIDTARSKGNVILLFTLGDFRRMEKGENFLNILESKYRSGYFSRS